MSTNTAGATGPTYTILVLLPHSVSSPQNGRTSDFGAAMVAPNWPSPVSNLTSTNQVDTDINNDDDSQSFVPLRKHNKSATVINGTNRTPT